MKTALGTQLKQRRLELKINQQELSDLSGVSINTIVTMEKGNGNPSLRTLEKICATLGVDICIQ